MTSTYVEKNITEKGDIKYKYIFEVLGNKVSKIARFEEFNLEAIVRNEEGLLLKSLLALLYSFTGHRNVIIGLGPGRCGTMSLAILLSAQESMVVHHEGEPRLSWNASIYEFIAKWSSLFYAISPPLPIIVDIANWYLPFVPYILKSNDKVKFICLRRDIDEIVNSFMLKVPNTSHWTDKKSKYWNKNWERSHDYRKHFPKYDLPKEEGCRKYVEEYYSSAENYAERLPNKFKIFNVNALNTEEGVKSILSFCGMLEDKMQIEHPYINRTTATHRKIMRKYKDTFGKDF